MGDVVKLNHGEKEIPRYYSNIFELTIGPYDFSFTFGYKTPAQAKKQTPEYDTLAYVSMSPTQAKTAVVILKEMLDKYEKDFGEIPLEKTFKERHKKIFGESNE